MYADKITDSMRRAMDETDRRRKAQLEYNQEHGIIPTSIIKAVRDVLIGKGQEAGDGVKLSKISGDISLDELLATIGELERDMNKAAKSLDFEQAAQLRDEITELKQFLPDAKWTK